MRVRIALAAAVAVGLLVALALASGGEDGSSAKLAWATKPVVQTPQYLPRDRVLVSQIRNDSFQEVDLVADDVRVLDPDGEPLRSTAQFPAEYAQGSFAPDQRPQTPDSDALRQRGKIVTIKPGQKAPLTLSWSVSPGGKQPVRVDLGVGSDLAIP